LNNNTSDVEVKPKNLTGTVNKNFVKRIKKLERSSILLRFVIKKEMKKCIWK